MEWFRQHTSQFQSSVAASGASSLFPEPYLSAEQTQFTLTSGLGQRWESEGRAAAFPSRGVIGGSSKCAMMPAWGQEPLKCQWELSSCCSEGFARTASATYLSDSFRRCYLISICTWVLFVFVSDLIESGSEKMSKSWPSLCLHLLYSALYIKVF